MSKILFLTGCIPIRLLLTYIAYYSYNLKNDYLRYLLSIISFMIGLSFLIIYTKGWRKTGVETEGREIWWNNLRPIHGFIYISFAILNMMNYKYAWTLLGVDVIIGLLAFFDHYYIEK